MPCPFALHLWIPTEFSMVDYGRMLSEAASNDTAELRFVWAKRGSTATVKLYALSGRLDELPRGASRDEVIKAMKGKVLAKASLSAKV